MCDHDSFGMNLPLSNKPSGVPKSSFIQPNLPEPFPLVTVCPSLSSFIHVIVSPILTDMIGGSYQTSAGVFSSGLNAPNGIFTVISSA